MERIESVLLRVRRSGERPFCLTSGRPLGRVEPVTSFVGEGLVSKERDTEETELEPD